MYSLTYAAELLACSVEVSERALLTNGEDGVEQLRWEGGKVAVRSSTKT